MKRFFPTIILGLIFFTFVIGRVQNSYDRIHPQFLYLAVVNFLSIAYIFYWYSLRDIINSIKKNKILFFYSLYILISVLSIMSAANKIESLVVLSQYLTFYFSFIVISIIVNLKSISFIKVFIYFTIVSVSIESLGVLYSVFDYVYVEGNPFTRRNEFASFAGNINMTAFSLVAKSSFVYYLLFKKKNNFKHYSVYFIILFSVSASLFFLLTRGAILAFGLLNLFIITYLLLKQKDNKYSFRMIALALTFFISYTLVSTIIKNDNKSNLINDRVASISLNSDDQSIGERLRFYNVSLKIISKNPILGIGLGNWKFESIKYDAYNLTEYTVPYHAHNDYLQIASEIGLLGLIFYLTAFILPLIRIIRNFSEFNDQFLIICFIGTLGVCIMDSMLNFPTARPISHIYYLFILTGFQNLIKTK